MALAPVEHESGSSTSDGASDDLDSLLREVARLPDARLPDVDPDRIVEQIAELRIPSQEAATPPSTSSRLRGLMTKVTHLGVDPALPRHETKHIVLTNQFALFVGAVSFAALIGPASATLLPSVRAWLAGGAVSSLIVLGLNHVRRSMAASAWLLASFLVVRSAIGCLEPRETEHAPLPLLIAAIAWFVFPPSRRLASVVATAASGAAVLWLRWAPLRWPPPAQLPGYDTEAIGTGNIVMCFVAFTFYCYWTANEMARVERELVAERAKTETLLKREVAHQVAERSRELGEALARPGVALPPTAASTATRFGVRYRVVRPLGKGGMGAVYEVERVTDGQHLALKVILGNVSRERAARFAREAEIGARLSAPNLVAIVDVGVGGGGSPFLVMELVTGGSLEGRRDRFGDIAWALPILRQVARGLRALHEAGVVHRDLKPGNVLLDDHGNAKVSDFGIARFGRVAEDEIDPGGLTGDASPPRARGLTGTGAWMGTPLYMAPEAARGGRDLETPADVFAFGILAFEMLTGQSPFATPPVHLALANQPIPAPAALQAEGLDEAVSGVIAACFAADPAQRPDARRLGDALGA